MIKEKIISAGIILSLFIACKHKPQIIAPIVNNPDPVTDTSLCFERDILPIFVSNCAKGGCHDAASHEEGYIFTSYATITAKKFVKGNAGKTELYEAITENDDDDIMPRPPAAPLTAGQIVLIRDWINRGAPNTTDCMVLCDSNQFTYSAAIQPLLNKYCKGCHSSAIPSGAIILDIYSGAQAVALNGRLLGALKQEPAYKAMPQGGNKLSDCEIRQIEKWIANGALNN